jgi:transcriptional regulator with XRE-family HTH domain
LVYYENGEAFHGAGLIDKIAGFFNVSSDFLTDDSESIAMTKEKYF